MKDTSKLNNLKTKNLPPLFMMVGGAVALLICLIQKQPLLRTLVVLFIALLAFALLGTVIKSIVDRFNMTMRYSDYFEDTGDLVEKRTDID
jgi:energy-coupling factor transporter transmembrane protein EcfT